MKTVTRHSGIVFTCCGWCAGSADDTAPTLPTSFLRVIGGARGLLRDLSTGGPLSDTLALTGSDWCLRAYMKKTTLSTEFLNAICHSQNGYIPVKRHY